MNIEESKDFLVSTGSLKEVRVFSREVFEKLKLEQDLKDELVLAIAEAAQNIVKHGYKGVDSTTDKMQIKISMKDSELEIGFFDKGKAVVPENVQHRKLDDIKPGGLGTFFIKQIMDAAVFKKDEKALIASYRREKRKKIHMSKRKGRIDQRTNRPGKRK